ncbi:MAG: cytochrome b/b6 domain-containing protein [Thiotrichales bacterium]|nr:MAG: cytochrome b/b6 domain-containing protein [Thiotrichales bacterium]
MHTEQFYEYRVWDLPTRLFHWINFTAVITLIFFGLVMLFKKDLGITSVEAKIGLKVMHVTVGYIFVANLVIRIIWGFVGNRYARWKTVLPSSGQMSRVQDYKQSLQQGKPLQYAGHNPLGQLAVGVIFLCLLVMTVTGLIRAGTDIYYPPFGSIAAEYVAQPGVDPASLVPYDKSAVDKAKYDALKAFKKPFGTIHIYTSYFLMFLIIVHIAAVVRVEVKEGGSIISAMFTGKKYLRDRAQDADEQT